MTLIEIVTAVVGILSIALLTLQVHIAARTLREDHVRRRQQATLEYLIHDVRPHWKDELRDLVSAFGDVVPMPEEAMNRIMADRESGRLIIKLLGNIEHMAVGVNVGVYDLDVLDRASGAFLIRIFNQFLPYIRRKQLKQPKAYEDFEALAVALCERRGRELPPPAPAHGKTHPIAQTEDDA